LNTIFLLITMQILQKNLFRALCFLVLFVSGHVDAQTAYGISRTQTFVINQTTGVATTPVTSPNGNDYAAQIGYESSAMAVSPLNGLLYMIERTATTTPRFATWNPSTGVATSIGTAGTVGADILRSTFCPDGRWYVSGNGVGGGTAAEIYELNPSTGAIVRTLNINALPQAGSGDIVCVSDGRMYISAQAVTGTAPYQLFVLTAAQLTTGGSQTVALLGDLGVANASQPNGLTEVTNNVGNCVSPCLFASGTPNAQQIWTINTSTGVAQTLTTASGAGMVDLSREFPRDISVNKNVTPTAALQGRTLTYTINVVNSGPAVAGSVTVVDLLNAGFINVPAASWTCTVVTAGSVTALTTACGAASGTGNVNTFANLSINSAVRYIITAPLLPTATGTVTNSVSANLTGTTFDPTTTNNVVTVTSTVAAATNLDITKTDNITAVGAGQTNSYTITVSNFGPANAPNAVVKDTTSAGLTCIAATCVVVSGTATCPAGTPAALMTALLSPSGVTLPTFNSGAVVRFNTTCTVNATGQ
jgi:uncharacterized repeat protein (TIGR01451 family)